TLRLETRRNLAANRGNDLHAALRPRGEAVGEPCRAKLITDLGSKLHRTPQCLLFFLFTNLALGESRLRHRPSLFQPAMTLLLGIHRQRVASEQVERLTIIALLCLSGRWQERAEFRLKVEVRQQHCRLASIDAHRLFRLADFNAK